MLGEDFVDDGQAESETVVDLKFDGECAQSTDGRGKDIDGVDIDLVNVKSDIHVVHEGSELEVSVVEAKAGGLSD